MSHRTRLMVAAAAMLVVAAAAASFLFLDRQQGVPVPAPQQDAAVRIERSVPFPLFLVHGMGSGAESWSGLTGTLQGAGLRSGGVLRLGGRGEPEFARADVPPDKADFFILQISNPYQSLQRWTEELANLLEELHQRTQGGRFILVGHSAGGVAGRQYLVEHPTDYHLAKLVTVSSPHLGSELPMLPIFGQELREWTAAVAGGRESLVNGAADRFLEEAEGYVGVPFDSPILPDLLPESLNPGLAALNAKVHPRDVEYACLQAIGASPSEDWETIQKVLARETSLDDVPWSEITRRALVFLQDGNAFRGDGAVSKESQDLRSVPFFQRHPELVTECRKVPADHSGIKQEYTDILFGITSPTRVLEVRREGKADEQTLVVDFQDFFAGLAKVTAQDSRTREVLRVSAPGVYQSAGEVFGRVEIGPLDTRNTGAVDLVVTSLSGRRYGWVLLLDGASDPPPHEEPPPVVVRLLRVEGIPWKPGLFDVGDDGGWRSDLQAILRADERTVLKTRILQDVGELGEVNEEARLAEDEPQEAWIDLQLIDVDVKDPSDLLGEIVWRPGRLPRGPVTVRTDSGLQVRLEVDGPAEPRIRWAQEPIRLPPSD